MQLAWAQSEYHYRDRTRFMSNATIITSRVEQVNSVNRILVGLILYRHFAYGNLGRQ